MARRYSASEKAKWVSEPAAPARRAPIQIPMTDNSALIEQNKLTLIGRVTNPAAQNTRALVDFFLQHWHVSGSITGRDLGPHLFQFSFESERDLQSILCKAPYHFKRWMILLQRWEPTVSESFPSIIPFWIRIHGLPLHYWTEEALQAIGSELGHVDSKDVTKGRIRVLINGLRPLDRLLEVSLPSGDIKEVELEYEKLEKHCFSCRSLSHEQDDCSSKPSTGQGPIGINQSRTLEKLAERRRRTDARTGRHHSSPNRSLVPSYGGRSYQGTGEPHLRHSNHSYDRGHRTEKRYETSNRRLPSPPKRSPLRRHETTRKEVWVPRKENPLGVIVGTDPRGSGRLSIRTSRQVLSPQTSHTPSPRPHREPMLPLAGANSDHSNSNSRVRRPALERISPAASLNASSERRPALERLSLPSNRDSLPCNEDGTTGSGFLQDVDDQYFEETMGDLPFDKAGASGSKPSQAASSPIRTLSEDRIHVSMRLGPTAPEPDIVVNLPLGPPLKRSGRLAAKILGKRKLTPQPVKKKIIRSPGQGVSIKKRRITKATNGSPKRSPRRKLVMTTEGAKESKAGASTSRAAPPTKVFPSSRRKVPDFRSPRDPLP